MCNLASVNLAAFATPGERSGDGAEEGTYDFQTLYEVTKVVTKNLNKVIDVNYYPVPEARNSNMRHRPIGMGVQGLADAFAKMRYPFDSEKAIQLNKDIFETMYYAAVEASCELAAQHGTYESYAGSPASRACCNQICGKTFSCLIDGLGGTARQGSSARIAEFSSYGNHCIHGTRLWAITNPQEPSPQICTIDVWVSLPW